MKRAIWKIGFYVKRADALSDARIMRKSGVTHARTQQGTRRGKPGYYIVTSDEAECCMGQIMYEIADSKMEAK